MLTGGNIIYEPLRLVSYGRILRTNELYTFYKLYIYVHCFAEGRQVNVVIHRDSERQLHFDSKFEHEEMVLVA